MFCDSVKYLQHPFYVEDTPGIVLEVNQHKHKTNRLCPEITSLVAESLRESDLVFFVIDGLEGPTLDDFQIAQWLKSNFDIHFGDANYLHDTVPSALQTDATRGLPAVNTTSGEIEPVRRRIRVRLLVNKTDEEDPVHLYNEVYKLGLGDPVFVSAQQGRGMHEVFREVQAMFQADSVEVFQQRKKLRRKRYELLRTELIEEVRAELAKKNREYDIDGWAKELDLMYGNPEENSDLDVDSGVDPKKSMNTSIAIETTGLSHDTYLAHSRIKMSVIGKPNAGKSSLVNKLLNRNRVRVSSTPHTTTDPVGTDFLHNGIKFRLVDTAGLEANTHLKSELEKLIYKRTTRSIQHSDVVLVVIDALEAFQNVDLSLVQMVQEEGRAVVLVVNKWDLVDPKWKERAAKYMMKQVGKYVAGVDERSLHFISATDGTRVGNILDAVHKTFLAWNTRISTGLLNGWLRRFKKVQKLPTERDHKLKIQFVVQIKSRPPTFAVFINDIAMTDENYVRFMKEHLQDEFKLKGCPIRLVFRATQYKATKKKVERVLTASKGDLRRMLLKRRKIRTFAKIKLDEMSTKRSSKTQQQDPSSSNQTN